METVSNVHCIEGINAHSYLVIGDQITLIDTGIPRNNGKILDYVENVLKRKPEDIKTIVLTHYYLDHTGSLNELQKATNAHSAVHKDDANYISGKKTAPDPFYMNITAKLMSLFTSYSYVELDIILDEKDTVDCQGNTHSGRHFPFGDILRFNGEKVDGPPSMLIRDHQALKKSVEKISNLDSEVMLPGHGKPLTKNASKLIKDYYQTL